MKALVTGGAGLVGSNLARRLLKGGHSVRILDHLSSGKERNIPVGARLIKGDILDKNSVKGAVEGIDVIFHLAAIASVPRSIEDPEKTFKVNVEGTKNILNAKNDEQRFVYTSSAAVYGNPRKLPISEGHALSPISPYGESKVKAEEICKEYENIVIVRPFNIYGPGQDSLYDSAIPKFIALASNNQPLIVTGDGNNTRDYVHVYDVCNALIMLAEKEVQDIYNIGTGKATKDIELAQLVKRINGEELEIKFIEARLGDIKHSYANILKIKSLGWTPVISLEQGLKGMMR